MKRKEIYILIVIVSISLFALFFFRRPKAYTGSSTSGDFQSQSGVTVAVQHGNQIVLEFDPDVDALYHVDGDTGGLDIEVKDKQWRVVHEKCPNHICAAMGWANKDSVIPITCLPNNIMIFVESEHAR